MTFSSNSCLICGTKVFFGEDHSLIKSRQETCLKFETLVSRFIGFEHEKFSRLVTRNPDNFNGTPVCCFTCLPIVESFTDTCRTWECLQLEMFHILQRISNLMISTSTSFRNEFVTRAETKRRQHYPYLRLEKQTLSERENKINSNANFIKSEVAEYQQKDLSDISTLNDPLEESSVSEHYQLDDRINDFDTMEMEIENPVSNYKDFGVVKIEITRRKKSSKKCKPALVNCKRPPKSKSWPCLMCEKIYFAKDSLERHLRSHTVEKPYHCPICQHEFAEKRSMILHRNFKHLTSRPNVACNICGKLVTDVLRHHNRMHGPNRLFCSVCGKGYPRQSELERHMPTHSQERNFSCDICQRTFKISHSLKRHNKLQHSDFRGIQCDICGKIVKHIQQHFVRAHKKVKKAVVVCTVCGKGFVKQSDLEKHRLSQHSRKPH